LPLVAQRRSQITRHACFDRANAFFLLPI